MKPIGTVRCLRSTAGPPARRALVDGVAVQVDVLDPVALGDRAGEPVGGDDTAVEQGLAGGTAGLPGLDHGPLDSLAAGEPSVGDEVADPAQAVGPGEAWDSAGAAPWVLTVSLSAFRPYG